jgi:hypothetical protein
MSSNVNNNIFDNNLNILQWNVRSLSDRLPSLIYLLFAQNCLVAILSENWLIPSRYINIPSFRIHRSDRPDGFGGVAVAIHLSLKSRLEIPIKILPCQLIHRFIICDNILTFLGWREIKRRL